MENVSLTYFLDFVLKSGTPKLGVVRDFKNRGEYDPQMDFYKPLRDRLIDLCRTGQMVTSLEPWAGTVHEKKQPAYLAVLAGLGKFFGRKRPVWFEPPKKQHTIGAVTLNVNPELGLLLHGIPHVIKVYLKDDPLLSKARLRLVLHVMSEALTDSRTPRAFGVLDARKGKLHTLGAIPVGLHALLQGEAAAFAAMHTHV